jgi:hypothetical protein
MKFIPHCDNNYINLAVFYHKPELAKPDMLDITYCNKI